MALLHPLDRPAWSALTGPQARFAITAGAARRYEPAYGVFAAAPDTSPASLAGLAELTTFGDIGLLEVEPPTAVPGTSLVSHDVGVQMVAARLSGDDSSELGLVALSENDAPEMWGLAEMTKPGPFSTRTHDLGRYFGVRVDGQLVAMAGERMRLESYVEISGVCTHPDHRGRGYGAALSRHVAASILARGQTPFLHAYAPNSGAISLDSGLGFALRTEVQMIRLTRA